jgi:hypothetical protein
VVEGLKMLLTSQNLPSLENRNAAAKKFIQAYKLGSALGTFLAGVAYKYGFGIKAPRLQLGEALIVVATQGYENPLALYFVGINLLHTNKLHGLNYLEAAASEIKEASLTLALVYLFRPDLVPTSYIKAIGHLQHAGLLGQGLLAKVQEHIAYLQQRQVAMPQEPIMQANYRPMPLLVH